MGTIKWLLHRNSFWQDIWIYYSRKLDYYWFYWWGSINSNGLLYKNMKSFLVVLLNILLSWKNNISFYPLCLKKIYILTPAFSLKLNPVHFHQTKTYLKEKEKEKYKYLNLWRTFNKKKSSWNENAKTNININCQKHPYNPRQYTKRKMMQYLFN